MSTRNSIKTEHAGAKNGGGYWGKRAEAKYICKRMRRRNSRKMITADLREAV